MIACNPRVYIESGNGTVASVCGLTDEGYGALIMNPTKEPIGIGVKEKLPDDFDYNNAAVTWIFKNAESLNVVINQLLELRVMMETYAKEELNKEVNTNG
jgi:hypothetical protein